MTVYTEEDEEKKDNCVQLRSLDENSELALVQYDKEQHFTQPPAHNTEASLVKTLEELGSEGPVPTRLRLPPSSTAAM